MAGTPCIALGKFFLMPRPKTILWVDDEAESLGAHVLFLEEHDYRVELVSNGDDALSLLRGQSYGAVLLDEQMPGRTGLELVGEIRAVDPSVPIVMVTKSEEGDTMRDAIGADLDDYLVKPVNPRQILTAVTRLLEGSRIRQQHVAREFVMRFRELEEARASHLGWRDWVELAAELAQWDVRLAEGGDSGLQASLRGFEASIRGEFASFISDNYPKWLANPDGDRPPLSVDVVSEFLIPTLQRYGKVLFVVVDCLRLDQWEMLKPSIANLFDVEVSHHYSILPTATPFSRNAIFAGLFPCEIAEKYPEWWHFRDDGRSLNTHEKQLLDKQLTELTGEKIPTRYEKMSSLAGGQDMLKRLSGNLSQPGVTSLVFNFVDQLTHGRSEHEILYQVASDAAALRSLTRTWFEDSALMAALKEAERRNVPVILTTDHGSIHCHSPATVFAKKDASKHLRYKFGEDVRTENPQHGVVVDDMQAWGLPPAGLGVRLTMATGDRFFVYPTKLREYQSRYKGSFLHGGVTPEEMIVPVALLTPRAGL